MKALSKCWKSSYMTKLCCIKALSSITAKKLRLVSKSFCFTFRFELTHRQATNTKIEELSSRVDDLSKLLKHKNEENKGLIEEKASVSQLQDQHSIELANHKTKLDDACKHYQNTLKEEQSKLQLVTQELESSKSDIVQLKTDANRNTVVLDAQKEESVELQSLISSLQQDLAAADLERQSLKSRSSNLQTQVVFSLNNDPPTFHDEQLDEKVVSETERKDEVGN
jgi:DNA repair exonuclease SbcCD ATPase subunit